MMSDNPRFHGIARLYGETPAETLKQAHICVIGLGGVGSWSVEALARTGIGYLTLVDHDEITEGNINRQLHSMSSTLGLPKAETLCRRVSDINPDCVCKPVNTMLTENNIETLLENKSIDFVIDAIDSVKHKAALIAWCRRNKLPIVTTGGAGGLTDPCSIMVSDLSQTWNDPLAAKVRSRLRYHHNFSREPKDRFKVPCVFSTQQPVYPQADGSVSQAKPKQSGLTLDCAFGYGSATAVTGAFGFAAAAEVIRRILEKTQKNK